jgi:putative transposase
MPPGGWLILLSRSFFPVPKLWVPRPCVFCKGRYDAAGTMGFAMPSGLHRTYGAHHLHFITCSCYRRLPFLDTARGRDRFLSILEQTRQRYRFVVVGFVVMPEHIHLLLTEPEVGNPSTVMQVLKQRTAHVLLPKRRRRNPLQRNFFGDEAQRRVFWQARFYDFNVWTTKKRVEKLRYMHRNPVERGLVETPEQWRWSSYRFYLLEEAGPVKVNEGLGKDFVSGSGGVASHLSAFVVPALRKEREGRGTLSVSVLAKSKSLGHPPG